MRNPKKNSGCENHCFNPLEPIKNSCCAIWIGRMHSTGGHVRGFNPEQWSFEFCTTTISILLYVYIQYIHIYIYIIFRIVIIIIIIVIIIIIIVVVVVLLLYYCGYSTIIMITMFVNGRNGNWGCGFSDPASLEEMPLDAWIPEAIGWVFYTYCIHIDRLDSIRLDSIRLD